MQFPVCPGCEPQNREFLAVMADYITRTDEVQVIIRSSLELAAQERYSDEQLESIGGRVVEETADVWASTLNLPSPDDDDIVILYGGSDVCDYLKTFLPLNEHITCPKVLVCVDIIGVPESAPPLNHTA